MSRVIVVVGPTATGKTKVSIELAHALDAVILNADSTGVYKEPLIATAKVREEEKEGIEHYLLDLVSLDDDYTLFDYQKDGRKLIDKFLKENKNIIIVGGSGLYLKALLYDYKLEETSTKRVDYSKYSNEELKSIADKIDINNNIHVNNRQRLERYITYYNETGNTIKKTNDVLKRVYDFELIGLEAPRNEIYKRCDSRVDEMIKDGLLEEAKRLYDMNLKNYTNIIGYRELDKYFIGDWSLEQAISEMKKNTRHYAKRQFTWFKNQMKDITWFNVDYKNFNNTIKAIKKFLNLI